MRKSEQSLSGRREFESRALLRSTEDKAPGELAFKNHSTPHPVSLTLCILLIVTQTAFAFPLPSEIIPKSALTTTPFPGEQAQLLEDMPIAGGLNSSIVVPGDTVYTLELINTRFVGSGGSDCWGWVAPDGVEYAIMGDANGISIWDFASDRFYGIKDPEDNCSPYSWRDMMTLGHYLYAVKEQMKD